MNEGRRELPWWGLGMLVLLWLVIVLVVMCILCGCSGAKQFAAPDASALNRRQAEVAVQVRAAKESVDRAKASLEKARAANSEAVAGHSREMVLVGEIRPLVAALRTKVADVALRAEVDALGAKLDNLAALEAGTSNAIASTGASHAEAAKDLMDARDRLTEAEKGQDEINAKMGPQYQAEVAMTISQANGAIVAERERGDGEEKRKWFWFSVALVSIAAWAVHFGRKFFA